MGLFAEHLNLKDFRVRTLIAYYRDMRLIHDYFGKNPKYLTQKQVRAYILHVKEDRQWAPQTVRKAIAAARMFYGDMLGKPWKLWDVVKVRDRETLPVVLDLDEVTCLFKQMPLLRYKVPLELIYNCGLRLHECLNLTVNDIEGVNNRLIIRNGKGGKDRYVPLSKVMYKRLQKYWLFHKNKQFVFPEVGRGVGKQETLYKHMHNATHPMHPGSLRKTMADACVQAKIKKHATIHTLRHSYATHLHAMGVSIRQLQVYLGHSTIETTTLYTHLVPFSEQRSLKVIDELAKRTR
jgi:site-specific recombinase XerD